jgi:hypothetical protein
MPGESDFLTDANSPRSPSQKTIKRLFALSGNRCAFPKCTAEIVCEGTVVGQICHIKAVSPGGPRYDAGQSKEERHSFENLLLLCGTHHAVIDDAEEAFTVQYLLDMKRKHEETSAMMSDDVAADGAGLLLSVNQSGGIVAHSVHAHTIHVHQGAEHHAGDERSDRARGYFTPELARVIGHQVYVLSRIVPNFIAASTGKTALPGDNWASLRPWQPVLYPKAAEFRDLSAADATSLIEFYDSLQEITDVVNSWVDSQTTSEVNAWNVLMQKVQKNLGIAQKVIQRLCPDQQYSAIMPAAGSLLHRSQREISAAQSAMAAHLARHGVS